MQLGTLSHCFNSMFLNEGATFPVIKGNDGTLEEKIMKSIGGEYILIIEEQR